MQHADDTRLTQHHLHHRAPPDNVLPYGDPDSALWQYTDVYDTCVGSNEGWDRMPRHERVAALRQQQSGIRALRREAEEMRDAALDKFMEARATQAPVIAYRTQHCNADRQVIYFTGLLEEIGIAMRVEHARGQPAPSQHMG